MKRISVKNPDKLIDEVRNGKSINSFADGLGVATSSLKAWRRGERTIPEDIFRKILKMSRNYKFWKEQALVKDENWGQKKGGMKRAKRKNLKKEMEEVRDFKQSSKVKIPAISADFCEFFGALLGDGCLSKYDNSNGYLRYEIVLSGDKKLDGEYHEYLEKKTSELFGVRPHMFLNKKSRGRRLCIFNRRVFDFLNGAGFPIGKKGSKLSIPKRFMVLPWQKLKFLVRGVFDTDGCISAKKSENYKYPILIISSMSSTLIEQLKEILLKNGHKCYLNRTKTELRLRGAGPTRKWMEDIESSNSRHIKKYTHWKEHNIVPVRARGSENF